MTGFYTSPSGLPLKHVSRLGWIRVSYQKTGQHYYGNGGSHISDVRTLFLLVCEMMVHIQTLHTKIPQNSTHCNYMLHDYLFFCIMKFWDRGSFWTTCWISKFQRSMGSNNKVIIKLWTLRWCQNISIILVMTVSSWMCCYFSGSPISLYINVGCDFHARLA